MMYDSLHAKINVSADRHAASVTGDSAVLIDASTDLITGTPTFFMCGIAAAQMITQFME